MIKRLVFLIVSFIIIFQGIIFGQTQKVVVTTSGQDLTSNPIQTPVTFLTIAPDSRASAMGDLGAATTPDANSMHWNAAKYAFIKDDMGGSLTYTPWLRGSNLASDINLAYLTYYKRIDKQSTFAAAIRYFSLGVITFINAQQQFTGTKTPNEFSMDAAYSRLFSDKFSGGITFRFIRSDLAAGQTISSGGSQTINAGYSFAADVSAYYRTPFTIDDKPAEWALGLNISNLGSKISYTDNAIKDFIPAMLRLGGSVGMNMDAYNKISIALDFSKLLVPTPDSTIKTSANDISVPEGMIRSLYQAPGGFNEKVREVMISSGLEYLYREQFAVRAGYFHESQYKGNRQYFTAGVGVKMNLLSIDFSYLIPTNGAANNPLANTMRITLSMNVDKLAKKKSKE